MKNLIFIAILLFSFTSQAQLFKKISSKIKEKVTKEINKSIHKNEEEERVYEDEIEEKNDIDENGYGLEEEYTGVEEAYTKADVELLNSFKDKVYDFDVEVTYEISNTKTEGRLELVDYFKKGATYSMSTNNLGGRIKNFSIYDGALVLGLMDYSGNKIKTLDLASKLKEDDEAFATVVATAETQSIQGYTCKKYIVTTKNKEKTICWATDALAFRRGGQSHPELKGFVMKMVTQNQQMGTIVFEVSSIDFNFKKSIDTSDYKTDF